MTRYDYIWLASVPICWTPLKVSISFLKAITQCHLWLTIWSPHLWLTLSIYQYRFEVYQRDPLVSWLMVCYQFIRGGD